MSAGTKMNSASIRITGATAIFQFLETNTTPSPPKSAGRICANAGASTGASRIGVRGVISSTPRQMMTIVTMLETAMATVETISPSSVRMLALVCSRAFSATGSFKFEMLPVTKLRYDPPAPSIGT